MRAWPIGEGLVVLVLGLLVLFPIWRVTSGPELPVPSAASAGTADGTPEDAAGRLSHPGPIACYAILRSAHPLRRVEVRHEGRVLCAIEKPPAILEQRWELPIGATGVELEVHAVWAPGTAESVVELTLEPDGRERRSATRWGQGEMDEILEFQWP